MINILCKEDFTKYMNSMKVYHKKLDPLNNIIQTYKTKMGRTTFYIPQIQQ